MNRFLRDLDPTLSTLLIAILTINAFFIGYLIVRHRNKSYILSHAVVASSLMIILNLTFVMYNYYSNKVIKTTFDSFENIRNILIIVSGVVAILSLLITSYNSSVTSRNSLETHRANVIFNLIKQNASIAESQNFLDSLKTVLEDISKIQETGYKFELARNQLESFLTDDENKQEYLDSIEEISNARFSKPPTGLLKSFLEDPLKKEEYTDRLLLTYYSERNIKILHEHFYNHKNKAYAFGTEFYTLFRSTKFGAKFEEYFHNNDELIFEVYLHEEISKLVISSIDANYKYLGTFFRNTHRIVKLINEYFPNTVDKKTYLGILRSYYSEDIMLLIYVNCVYTQKGVGLAKQLVRTDFFGDEFDFDLENNISPHVQINSLFHKDLNISILKLFTSKANIRENKIISEIQNVFDKEIA